MSLVAEAGTPLVDFAPVLRLALLALVVALLPLGWLWLRQRGANARARMAALTALTLFLTFDLIVFGAYTRLSDSGLGCPDWPGCYGQASPLGAAAHIEAAQLLAPGGPVSWSKAWIEMIHRYLAMTVGVLILVMTLAAWRERSVAQSRGGQALAVSPWWPTVTLAWVIVQGLFGKYTVTLKLYPAVVTLHLLGGLTLLALLAWQHAAFSARPAPLAPGLRRMALAALAVLAMQVALGGWVSTNYAVLACRSFPLCEGAWWPAMDFSAGFTLFRGLGVTAEGGALPYQALMAIHMAHRWFAVVVAATIGLLAWRLWRHAPGPTRRAGVVLAALLIAQMASGLSNVVLGWPLAAALGHSAGAAALVLVLALLLARSQPKAEVRAMRLAAGTA